MSPAAVGELCGTAGDRSAAVSGLWRGGYTLENAKDAEYRPVGDRPSLVHCLLNSAVLLTNAFIVFR